MKKLNKQREESYINKKVTVEKVHNFLNNKNEKKKKKRMKSLDDKKGI